MLTLLELLPSQVFPFVGETERGLPRKRVFQTSHGTFKVKANSKRLECFRRNQACVRCGIIGNVFLLQMHTPSSPKLTINCLIRDCMWCWARVHKIASSQDLAPHLNFFYRGKSGKLILMTQDHIIPSSRGGETVQSNLQTMCTSCNSFKGDDIDFKQYPKVKHFHNDFP